MARLLFLAVFLGLAGQMLAAPVTLEGPVHEAYIAKIQDVIVLQPIQQEPPASIREKTPEQIDPRTVWIPGYWAWDDERGDFIWIAGIWRKNPPDCLWIPGMWKKFPEGWVWISGFFSQVSESELKFVKKAPPLPLEEEIGNGPGDHYFWVPGYWVYSEAASDYQWRKGRFEEFDPAFVLVPAHYVWRDKGYALINAYWDWPLKNRGTAYAALYLPLPERIEVYTYVPSVIIDNRLIQRRLFFWYYDYLYFYQYSYYFDRGFWQGFSFVPPWWNWRSWWTLSSRNQLALWWWWSHPGYPQPLWLTPAAADQIAPPSSELVDLVKETKAPALVTPQGVATSIAPLETPILTKVPEVTKKPEAVLVPKGNSKTSSLNVPKLETSSVKSSKLGLVPSKPYLLKEEVPAYRVAPSVQPAKEKNEVRTLTYPSKRPSFEPQTWKSDVFKAPAIESPAVPTREKYVPPQKVQPISPFGEVKEVYRPTKPTYSPPPSDYTPPSYRGTSSSNPFSGDLYSPPASMPSTPHESIRKPVQFQLEQTPPPQPSEQEKGNRK